MSVDIASLAEAVRNYAVARAETLSQEYIETLQAHMPYRTGELHDSVHVTDFDVGADAIRVTVTVEAEHARWVNDGTGIFGPNGAPIYPTSASVLVFDWPAAGGIVFARHVQGMEATHFMERTADAWPGIVAAA